MFRGEVDGQSFQIGDFGGIGQGFGLRDEAVGIDEVQPSVGDGAFGFVPGLSGCEGFFQVVTLLFDIDQVLYRAFLPDEEACADKDADKPEQKGQNVRQTVPMLPDILHVRTPFAV